MTATLRAANVVGACTILAHLTAGSVWVLQDPQSSKRRTENGNRNTSQRHDQKDFGQNLLHHCCCMDHITSSRRIGPERLALTTMVHPRNLRSVFWDGTSSVSFLPLRRLLLAGAPSLLASLGVRRAGSSARGLRFNLGSVVLAYHQASAKQKCWVPRCCAAHGFVASPNLARADVRSLHP